MEPVHAKEALSLLGRVPLFDMHNEEDGGLQRAIEDMYHKDITIVQRNKHQFFFFFIAVKCFYNMFILYKR